MSDENADDIEHLLYQSFGRSLRNPNSIHQEQRNFTSHELDPETNYLYAGSRYLDPTIGRFISQDPVFREIGGGVNDKKLQAILSDPQLLNSYSYSKNNPLRFVDKEGEFPWEVVIPQIIAPYLAKKAREDPAGAASLGISFIPGASEGHDATSFLTGIDPITGEQLSTTDRIFSGVGLLPIVSGGMLKGGKKIVENVFTAISRLFRKEARFNSVDDLIGAAGKLDILKHGESQGFIKGNADEIFQDLSKQYKAGIEYTDDGVPFFKADDFSVHFYPSSKTGAPTLSVKRGDKITKIRVEQ